MIKKIILVLIILISLVCQSYALDLKEVQDYIGEFCYIKYYRYEKSDIEIYNEVIGKVWDIIYDEGYKFIILDYKVDLYLIRIEKVKIIKILKTEIK